MQLQDVTDQETRDSYRNNSFINFNNVTSERNSRNSNGFVVEGAPWEQPRNVAPNTASVTEFPSFGGNRNRGEPLQQQQPTSPVTGAWGFRR